MSNIFGYNSVEELRTDEHQKEIDRRTEVLEVVNAALKMLNEAEYLYNSNIECHKPSFYESNTQSINILGGWKERILFEIKQREEWISQLNKKTSC